MIYDPLNDGTLNGCDPDNFHIYSPVSIQRNDGYEVYDVTDDSTTLNDGTQCDHSRGVEWRHHGWKSQRSRLLQALERTAPSKLDRVAACGSNCYVESSRSTGNVRVTANHCGHRMCRPCSNSERKNIALNLEALTANATGSIYFLTLLYDGMGDAPLKARMAQMLAAFAKLRHSKLWVNFVESAFMAVESKWYKGRRTPHIHVLIEAKAGTASPSGELPKAKWNKLTGHDDDAHISKRISAADASQKVSKYVAKPTDASVYDDPDELDAYLIAIDGLRLTEVYGKWRGKRIREAPDPPESEADEHDTIKWGPLSYVLSAGLYRPEIAPIRRHLEALRKTLLSPPPKPVPQSRWSELRIE